MVKKILIALAVFVALIQLIRPARNESPVEAAPSRALSYHFPIPDSVERILKAACYDCHSNNSRYPWFDKIAPVSWFVAYHIRGGKRHLNFDEFYNMSRKKRLKRLHDIAETVGDGTMPLSTYAWAHKDAILTPGQKTIITGWTDILIRQMSIEDTTLLPL
jgi:hypothetical protein